jgi:competence protein ComEA
MTAGVRRAGLLLTLLFSAGLPFALAFAAKKPPPPHSVNLNTASLHDLMTLPGIGPTRAEAILEFRRKNGQFRSVNDLLVIHGMSKKRVAALRPYLTLTSAPSHAQPAKPNLKSKPATTTTTKTPATSPGTSP